MRLVVVAVGRASRLLEPALAEYAERAGRYWNLEILEVREERAGRGRSEEDVRSAEAERMIKRVPRDSDIVAVTRNGAEWSSTRLAEHLRRHVLESGRPETYVIGGAYGLGDAVMGAAHREMSLSAFTMPHDLARLVLLEQLYRAGTILRGEPYHKGSDAR